MIPSNKQPAANLWTPGQLGLPAGAACKDLAGSEGCPPGAQPACWRGLIGLGRPRVVASFPGSLCCGFAGGVRRILDRILPLPLRFSCLIYKMGLVAAENICEMLSLF